MLDLTAIVVSSLMMLLVTLRAIKMDREQPWFQTVKIQAAKLAPGKQPWQR